MLKKISNCLFCNSELPLIEGKRKREFCNGNCRNKYYYKKSREGVSPKKVGRPKGILEVIMEREKEVEKKLKEVPLFKTKKEIVEPIIKDEYGQNPILTYIEKVHKEIEAIRSEKLPAHRNTTWGKKSWEAEQKQKIKELQNKLNENKP